MIAGLLAHAPAGLTRIKWGETLSDPSSDSLQPVLTFILKLLRDSIEPELPPEQVDNAQLIEIYQYLKGLRQTVAEFSVGDFSHDIRYRGALAGRLKALQANLRHMLWQLRQVEKGDFTQRIDFLGDFSDSFNGLVEQLHNTLTVMKAKERELTALSESLSREIEHRNSALCALERREAQYRYLAERDPLTDTLNRRSFFDVAKHELQITSLSGLPACLAFLDVDFFKRFNDTYGHPEGDIALRHVANVSQSRLRQNDVMGRYGGEEFIFLFPGAECKHGIAAAERIRKAIEGTPVVCTSGLIPITASLGVVEVPPQAEAQDFGEVLSQAVRSADMALYAAKHAGRNCVCVAEFGS